MNDEESEVRLYPCTGDNERKAQGNFRREEVRYVSGIACWDVIDCQHVLLNLADKQGCEIQRVGEMLAEVRVPISEGDAVDGWRYHPWLGVFRNQWWGTLAACMAVYKSVSGDTSISKLPTAVHEC